MSFETVYTKETRVSCKGTEDAGHPIVYLELSKKGETVCPYCSKVFILEQ